MSAHLNGCPLTKVLIDNGAIVNILLTRILSVTGKTVDDLIPSDVSMSDFSGGSSDTRGVIALQLQVRDRVMGATFFVIDSISNYNLLLGKDLIHSNGCVPLSLHQALIFLIAEGQEGQGMKVFWAEANPFKTDIHNVEAMLYAEEFSLAMLENKELKSRGIGLTYGQF